ncbi:DNA polymerase III subunit gamma/tau [Candidatus Parcubacteria bacterium]|nr:DNA polymerase III subunit gamma/tau [Candidatus Parcubacteria bacterium]
MSQVFYRKYRPQKFSEFVGQGPIVKILTQAIAQDRISHAYLFGGPRGTGKTTLARLLAKAINCEKRKLGTFEPCNECQACQEIKEGKSIDLVEIDAASHRGIDEIRELREGVKFLPAKLKYKVYIIDEAHQLTKEAANALLKTLEEPPSRTVFVLATTELHKMIPTIVSRCQTFEFKKLGIQEIALKLKKIAQEEKIKIENEAIELIASHANGALRDAEGILEKVTIAFPNQIITKKEIEKLLGLFPSSLSGEFLDFILKKDLKGGFLFIKNLVEKGVDLEEFVKSFLSYLHQILLFKILGEKEGEYLAIFTKEELEKLKNQSNLLSPVQLKIIIENFSEVQYKMKFTPIVELPLEIALVETCQKI